MYKGKRFLAVVPARGGSVSVPLKNIRPLAGKPLLRYTIDQAAAVPELDAVVVSTDDSRIAGVAVHAGGRVVDRPGELATATAPTEWALLHALDALGDDQFDYVVLLEPTSPFRTPATISRCIRTIVDEDVPSLVTVVETKASLGRISGNRFKPLWPNAPRRRQDREPLYCESSTVYVCTVAHLRRYKSLVADEWGVVEIAEGEALDINTLHDFAIAEALMKNIGENQ